MDNVIIYDKLEELNEGIESNGGGIESLLSNALLNAGSVVKSIQRGVYTQASTNNKTVTVPISQVNVQKSLLIFDKTYYATGAESDNYITLYERITFELTDTHILISNPEGARKAYKLTWQVIEFY